MFIRARQGHLINCDFIRRVAYSSDGITALDAKGIDMGSLFDADANALTDRIIPAYPGTFATMLTYDWDEKKFVNDQIMPVVAWRIVNTAMDEQYCAIPIAPEATVSNTTLLLHLPENKYMVAEYDGAIFNNLEDAKKAIAQDFENREARRKEQ